jgi:hypothetical protein
MQTKVSVSPAVEAVNPLVGKFFHSFEADKKTIKWQGIVESEVSSELLLVQLFSWLTGEDIDQVLVPVADMKYWKFYPDADAMNEAWQKQRHRY